MNRDALVPVLTFLWIPCAVYFGASGSILYASMSLILLLVLGLVVQLPRINKATAALDNAEIDPQILFTPQGRLRAEEHLSEIEP